MNRYTPLSESFLKPVLNYSQQQVLLGTRELPSTRNIITISSVPFKALYVEALLPRAINIHI